MIKVSMMKTMAMETISCEIKIDSDAFWQGRAACENGKRID